MSRVVKSFVSGHSCSGSAGLGPKPLVLPTTRKPLAFMHYTADGRVFSNAWAGSGWSAIGAITLMGGRTVPASVRRMNTR